MTARWESTGMRRRRGFLLGAGFVLLLSACGARMAAVQPGPSPPAVEGADAVAAPPAPALKSGPIDLSGQGTAAPPLPPPTQVVIPAIGVDAPVVDVGRNPDGSVQVPTSLTSVGWFDPGPAPGQPGPAAILGHLDSYTGPAVFFRLRQLRPGDRVDVLSGKVERVFQVTALSRFSKNAFPTAEVWGPTPDPELRLITCGGPFNASIGHYEDNVVVFARVLSDATAP